MPVNEETTESLQESENRLLFYLREFRNRGGMPIDCEENYKKHLFNFSMLQCRIAALPEESKELEDLLEKFASLGVICNEYSKFFDREICIKWGMEAYRVAAIHFANMD